jgi:hypothetical protein
MGSFTRSDYEAFLARRAASRPLIKQDSVKPSPGGTRGEASEERLRAQVIEYCRQKEWLVFSGTTAHRTGRTVGEPDLTIAADHGVVYFVELKSSTGKLRPEQSAAACWLQRLGHAWMLIRSLQEFIVQTQNGLAQQNHPPQAAP